MNKTCSLAILAMFLVSIMLVSFGCGGSTNNQLSSNSNPPKIEVAGIDTSELLQLRKVVEDVVLNARTSANQDQKKLLNQVETILGTVQSESQIENVVLQKTGDEQLILTMLEGTVGILSQSFLGIRSEIASALAKGIGELSSQITSWWEMKKIGWVKITLADKGVVTLVYQKDLKEVWVTCDISNPSGSVSMYTPVEISSVPSDNAGSSVAAVILKAVVENSRVAYRFGNSSSPSPSTNTPTTTKPTPTTTVITSENFAQIKAIQFGEKLFANDATDLKRESIFEEYKGKQVRWIGTLSEVNSINDNFSATVEIIMPAIYQSYNCHVDIPAKQKNVLLDLSKGDIVVFQGTLTRYQIREVVLTERNVYLSNGTIIDRALNLIWSKAISKDYSEQYFLSAGNTLFHSYKDYFGEVLTIAARNSDTGEIKWQQEYDLGILLGFTGKYINCHYQIIGADNDQIYAYAVQDNSLGQNTNQLYILAFNQGTGENTWKKSYDFKTYELESSQYLSQAVKYLNELGVNILTRPNQHTNEKLNMNFEGKGTNGYIKNVSTNEIYFVWRNSLIVSSTPFTTGDYKLFFFHGSSIETYQIKGLPW